MTCTVVENGSRCAVESYTFVRDPTSHRGDKRPICKPHFDRALYRSEIFSFYRAPRDIPILAAPTSSRCSRCGVPLRLDHKFRIAAQGYEHFYCEAPHKICLPPFMPAQSRRANEPMQS